VIKLGNIKSLQNPTYLVKLKELVPAYVIALFTAVALILEAIFQLDPPTAKVLVIILIIIAGLFTIYIEHSKNNVNDKIQIVIAVANGVAWLIVVNFRFLGLDLLTELVVKFFIALWTGICPFLREGTTT